jgi:hypothetical protein
MTKHKKRIVVKSELVIPSGGHSDPQLRLDITRFRRIGALQSSLETDINAVMELGFRACR